MANKNFWNKLKNFGNKPVAKKSFSSSQTIRNRPYEGFTDKMLDYLCNSTNRDANWVDLYNNWLLMSCYESNPVVNAVINIKADAWSNMRFKVKDLKTDEIIDISDYVADGGKLKSLLSKPNPLQSTFEWLKQYKINYATFGNSYVYASVPVGSENVFDYKMINVMNNLPPANVKTFITGKWLEATTKEEIIDHYELTGINGNKRDLNTNQVWQTNVSNIRLNKEFVNGVSKLVALRMPISNIDAAFETRNVMLHNRGALGFLSSEKVADGLGSIALDPSEIDQVQKSMNKYGTLNGQYNHIVSPLPMKYVRMAMSLKDLMVFEEVESDAVAISNSYGVPELLMKYYISGGTFENISASEKRLYDSTIIPESKDFMIGLNNFFKTEDLGIELQASFDHVAALQKNKKEEAETNKVNAETKLDAFKAGAIIYNDYLESLNLPDDPTIGHLRIWDLSVEQLIAIGVIRTNTNSNESE